MLIIGDIHITSKYKEKILTNLRTFVASQPTEKHLIFLGDFVYHFSYDRGALLALYDFFLELYVQGKTLYILAGNHDWLGNSFVFDEARKAFEVMGNPTIYFITQPWLTEIEGKNICFLPYMLDIPLAEYPWIEAFQDDWYHEQIKTGNKNQIFSAKLHLLVQYFQHQKLQSPDASLTFMHHYYFDGVVFPGQKSKFSFRDVALSSQRLDEQHLCFVSGHLHQSFTYKNYLCTGSVRATSPLEENQLKGVRKWSGAQWSFYEMGVNAYFAMESAAGLFPSPLTSDEVIAHYEQLKIKLKENLLSLPVEYHFLLALDLKTVVLSLRVEELKYQQMDSFVLPELQTQLADIKLKRQQVRVEDLLEKLQKPDSALLKSGFSGWIDLLKAFLRKQYPESYQEYEKLLQELELV